MKKIVALNLKMNLNYEDAQDYVKNIKNKISDKHDVIVFPSHLYLDMFKHGGYKLGAQNVHFMDKGAFTGEISPLQLKTMGIYYVIVGHSERRVLLGEDDNFINLKIKGCLKNNLRVIFCIGETEEERRLRKTAVVLKRQIKNGLKDIDSDDLKDVIIAYEPVWAIGTGVTPKPAEIEDSIAYISKIVVSEYGIRPKVLYGGSVDKNNIKDIIKIKNVDGVLIGSSSVVPNYLIDMLDLVE